MDDEAEIDENEIMAFVEASAPRRLTGISMLMLLGALVIYVALTNPPSLGWQFFLLVMGGGALWMGSRMYRATAGRIELTPAGLFDQDGNVIAAMDDIVSIDRGVFAFKPSNGFLVKTRSAHSRRWEAGLWWRNGRRVGVGGVTSAGQTKFMSEIIAAMIAQRDA